MKVVFVTRKPWQINECIEQLCETPEDLSIGDDVIVKIDEQDIPVHKIVAICSSDSRELDPKEYALLSRVLADPMPKVVGRITYFDKFKCNEKCLDYPPSSADGKLCGVCEFYEED